MLVYMCFWIHTNEGNTACNVIGALPIYKFVNKYLFLLIFLKICMLKTWFIITELLVLYVALKSMFHSFYLSCFS